MTTIIVIGIFLILVASYGLIRRQNSHPDRVYNAKAGGADEETDGDEIMPFFYDESKAIRLPNGNYANSNDFYRLVVKGKCMEPVKIMNNEEWLAVKIDAGAPLINQIKVNDVVLIHLKDDAAQKDYYKIRRVKRINTDTNTVDTYWYNDHGGVEESSRPHGSKLIMGVLQYKISQ